MIPTATDRGKPEKSKSPKHIRIPDAFLTEHLRHLSGEAVKIYLVLLRYMDYGDGTCWPGQDMIAAAMGVSTRTVRRHTPQLIKRGIVEVKLVHEAGKTQNHYRIIVRYGDRTGLSYRLGGGDRTNLVGAIGQNCPGAIGQDCPPNINQENINQEHKPKREERTTSLRFKKPGIGEIAAYCQERKNQVNPQQFLDYYESNGWRVGRSPMKNWRAAVRRWESNAYHAKARKTETVAEKIARIRKEQEERRTT